MENNIRDNLLLDFYGSMLTEKQKEVMRLYIECDSSYSEIASILSMSRQAVYDNVKVSKAQLETYEEKLKCVERFLKNREKLLEISNVLGEVEAVEKNSEIIKKLQNARKNLEKVLQNQ